MEEEKNMITVLPRGLQHVNSIKSNSKYINSNVNQYCYFKKKIQKRYLKSTIYKLPRNEINNKIDNYMIITIYLRIDKK